MEQTHSCKFFRLLADEYINGELTGEEMREFEAHIAECPECRKEFEELRALKEILAESDEELPEGFHERIMTAVSAEIKPQRSRFRLLRHATISAACAVICLSLTVIFAILPLWQKNTGSGLPEDPITDAVVGGETVSSAEEADRTEIDYSSVSTSLMDEDHTPPSEQPDSEAEEITAAENIGTAPTPEATYPAPNDTNAPALTNPETMVIPETAKPATEASPVETVAPETEAPESPDESVDVEGPATEAPAELPESEAATEPATETPTKTDHAGTPPSASLKDDTLAPSPEANAAPGGDEITLALLIVSGLLAVASFIAFLISLSSVRNASPGKKDEEEQ